MLGARRVRAAALFCPPVEEPEREAGPAAMGHPPWGSEHGLYVVVVNAGGALMGREQSNPAGSHEAGGSLLSMGIPWTLPIVHYREQQRRKAANGSDVEQKMRRSDDHVHEHRRQ